MSVVWCQCIRLLFHCRLHRRLYSRSSVKSSRYAANKTAETEKQFLCIRRRCKVVRFPASVQRVSTYVAHHHDSTHYTLYVLVKF